jgi:Ca2+-transporting ATPase
MNFENIEGHEVSISELKEILKFNELTGLETIEINKKYSTFGFNQLPKKKISLWKIYLAPLFNIMISIYLIVVVIYFLLTIWNPEAFYEASTTLIIIATNFAVSVIQQYRSTKKIDALHKLSTPYAKVIRNNGILGKIESKYLVPGDIIVLEAGDRIPADSRIIDVNFLEINESILTGESEPVEKFVSMNGLKRELSIPERTNMVFQGTYVHTGNSKAIVVKTGSQTQIGKINEGLNQVEIKEIQLVKKINKIGVWLTLIMLTILSISVTFQIIYLENQNLLNDRAIVAKYLTESLISTISIIPINIPILITIILTTGVFSMAQQKVVIKNLSSIESLGRISILCSDKTGTITKGQMTSSLVYDGNRTYNVLGKGYEPGISLYPTKSLEISENQFLDFFSSPFSLIRENSSLELIFVNSLLNNDSQLIIEDYIEAHGRSWRTTGNPTDAALLNLFRSSNLNESAIKIDYSIQKSYPFDSKLKMMSKVFFKSSIGKSICFTKGASENVLDKCTNVYDDKISSIKELSNDEKTKITDLINQYSFQGYRIISFAFKDFFYNETTVSNKLERELIEKDLIYLGFVCLIDPPRESVEKSVEELHSAGITPIMITGDNSGTAVTIAKKIGIFKENSTFHVGNITKSNNLKDFNSTAVFSRVSPEDKVEIINRYQKQERIVAMTGDGVNDALALTRADVGIAMGIAGTELTKQSADMVISDDSFNSIVKGIREGRSLFYKVRVIIFFYVAVAVTESMIYFISGLISGFFVLDFWQRAYIFLLVHFLPPMALIFDHQSKDIMKQRPLDSADILNKNLLINMAIFTFSFFIVLVSGYFIGNYVMQISSINQSFYIPDFSSLTNITSLRPKDLSQAKARTYFITIVYIGECLLVLSLRRMNMNIFTATLKEGWWFIYFCVFFLLITHVINMYFPFFQENVLLRLNIQIDIIGLDLLDWLICIILGIIPIFFLELHKKYVRSRKWTF